MQIKKCDFDDIKRAENRYHGAKTVCGVKTLYLHRADYVCFLAVIISCSFILLLLNKHSLLACIFTTSNFARLPQCVNIYSAHVNLKT